VVAAVNYRELGYFDRFNETLLKYCDWQVELFTSDHDGEESLRVFRLKAEADSVAGGSKIFMGCIPPETPVGSLICCGSLCRHYYQLGQFSGQLEASI